MGTDEKATKDEPQLGEIARRYLESVHVLAADETGTKKAVATENGTGTKRRAEHKADDKVLDIDFGAMFSANLTLMAVGTSDDEDRQDLLDRIRHGGCLGIGLYQYPGDHSCVMVMALMHEGWRIVGHLRRRDALAIESVVNRDSSKDRYRQTVQALGSRVQVLDWEVVNGYGGRNRWLRIHVSIS